MNHAGLEQKASSIAIHQSPSASCRRSAYSRRLPPRLGALGLDHQRAAIIVNHSAGDETRFFGGWEGYVGGAPSGWPMSLFERTIFTTRLLLKRLVPLPTDAGHGNGYCGTARNGEEHR